MPSLMVISRSKKVQWFSCYSTFNSSSIFFCFLYFSRVLKTGGLWVRISLLSLKLQIRHLFRASISLTFRQTIECRFTLTLVRDMIITYCEMHRTDKYSQHSSIIWPIWPNGWVFVYELSGCRLEYRSRHLIMTLVINKRFHVSSF